MSARSRRRTDSLTLGARGWPLRLAVALALSAVGTRAAHAEDAGPDAAQSRGSSLSLTIVPEGVEALEVVVDDRPLKPERLGRALSVVPGAHAIEARGVLAGSRMSATQTVTLRAGEHADVRVVMVKSSSDPAALTPGQIACMKVDKTPEEAAACFCGAEESTVGQRPGCHACALGSRSRDDHWVALGVVGVLALAIGRRRFGPTCGTRVSQNQTRDAR